MNHQSSGKVFLLLMLAIFGSCSENTEPTIASQDLNGTYTGTFQRFSSTFSGEIALVEINFDNGTWGGTSSIQKYPALCAGEYTTGNGEISFTNNCFWTTEFDWSLILSGTFKLRQTQTSLSFEKTYGKGQNQFRDVYIFPIGR